MTYVTSIPDSNYAAPTRRQKELRETLEQPTVPQQREILNKVRDELVGGVFRREPLRFDPPASKVTALAPARLKRRKR